MSTPKPFPKDAVTSTPAPQAVGPLPAGVTPSVSPATSPSAAPPVAPVLSEPQTKGAPTQTTQDEIATLFEEVLGNNAIGEKIDLKKQGLDTENNRNFNRVSEALVKLKDILKKDPNAKEFEVDGKKLNREDFAKLVKANYDSFESSQQKLGLDLMTALGFNKPAPAAQPEVKEEKTAGGPVAGAKAALKPILRFAGLAPKDEEQKEKKANEPQSFLEWQKKSAALAKERDEIDDKLQQYEAGITQFKNEQLNAQINDERENITQLNDKLFGLIQEPNKQKKDALILDVKGLLAARDLLLSKDPLNNDDQEKLIKNTENLRTKLGHPIEEIKDDLEERDALSKTIAAKKKKIEASLPGHEVKIKNDQGEDIGTLNQKQAEELRKRRQDLEKQIRAGIAEAIAAENPGHGKSSAQSKDLDGKTNYDFTQNKDILEKFKQSCTSPISVDTKSGNFKITFDTSKENPKESITVTKNKVTCTAPSSETVLRANANLFIDLMIKNGKSLEDGQYHIQGPQAKELERIFKEERDKRLSTGITLDDAKKGPASSGLTSSGIPNPPNAPEDKGGSNVDANIGPAKGPSK